MQLTISALIVEKDKRSHGQWFLRWKIYFPMLTWRSRTKAQELIKEGLHAMYVELPSRPRDIWNTTQGGCIVIQWDVTSVPKNCQTRNNLHVMWKGSTRKRKYQTVESVGRLWSLFLAWRITKSNAEEREKVSHVESAKNNQNQIHFVHWLGITKRHKLGNWWK